MKYGTRDLSLGRGEPNFRRNAKRESRIMQGTKNAKTVGKKKKLGMEQLEKREVFAGNVTAFIDTAGLLHVNGDAAGNQIEIREIGTNVYRVSGFTGTTVNGASYRDFYVATDKLGVYLAGGDDYVYIHDSVLASMDVHMGQGNDTVYTNHLSVYGSGNSAVFKMGASTETGNDNLYLYNDHFYGNIHATMGAGNDYVSFYNTRVDYYLSVWGEGGTDSYSWTNSSYGLLWAWNSIEKRI